MHLRTPALFATALGLVALAAGAAPATGTPNEKPPVHLWLEQGGDKLAIDDLGDLASGESRDYTSESGKRVTVTREANGYTVDVDGRKIHLGGLAEKPLASGTKIDRVERIEIGDDGAQQLVIGLGDGAGPASADAGGKDVIFLGPDLPLPPGGDVDALVASLEQSARFQALDDTTQQLVRDIVRESAPRAKRFRRIEVRRLPGLESEGSEPRQR